MQLSRESILRMFEGSGSGGSGGGAGSSQIAAMLQGYATQAWVAQNFLSIDFFNRLFKVHSATGDVLPNDTETTITDIEAVFGFWTEKYISALGKNSSGGGGGGSSTLAGLDDVQLSNPQNGQALVYNNGNWVNGTVIPDLTDYATKVWVQQQGYITASALTGYATESWVQQQGYITASALTGYATESWVTGKGYATQSALTAAVSRITTLEGYFTNGVANQAARLSGSSTYQAWGQTFWQNGTPKSIGSASARANINYAGSVNMGYVLAMEYDGNDVHDPAIYMKALKTDSNLAVLMLHNDDVNNKDHHLAIGFGTSARAQLPIRFFGREFVFNFTTDTVNSSGYYQTAEAMRVGYRTLDSLEEPAVYVRKHLMIGDGAGNYFPVTYDYTNNALCFTGNIYATGGISALGFQSTPGGGTLFNGPFTVNGAAILRSTLNVTGAATLNSSLTVADTVTLNDDLDVSANARIGGSLTALGTTTLNDALTVTGAATFRDSIYIYYGGTRYTLSISKLINQGLLT